MTRPHPSKGRPARRGRQVSTAEFARMWRTMTTEQIGAALGGLTLQAVAQRARVRGLPPKGKRKPTLWVIPAARESEFRRMWLASVEAKGMAAHFGCEIKSIRNTRCRLDLPRRPRGNHQTITLDEWREMEIGRLMAEAVARDRAEIARRQTGAA